jgi:hypothetical protein
MGGAVRVIFTPPEERDAPGPDEAALEDVLVVRFDLRPTRAFLEAALGPALLYLAAAEPGRSDAVEDRRLVQLDEGRP